MRRFLRFRELKFRRIFWKSYTEDHGGESEEEFVRINSNYFHKIDYFGFGNNVKIAAKK